jgi:ribosomal 30S subunit maturation factor RimM
MASSLKGYRVFSRRGGETPGGMGEDEFLVRDLVGMRCFLAEGGQEVGVVRGVVPPSELCDSAPASKLMHAMLEVLLPPLPPIPGRRGEQRLCLVPLVAAIVVEVDRAGGRVVLNPPPGLLEVTYSLPLPDSDSDLESGSGARGRPGAIKGFLPEVAIGLTLQERLEFS